MSINVHCETCGHDFDRSKASMGKLVKCHLCKTLMAMPDTVNAVEAGREREEARTRKPVGTLQNMGVVVQRPHTKSLATQAAHAGWIAPLLAVALGWFVGTGDTPKDRTAVLLVGVLVCVVILVGVVCALWAITSALLKGPRRLLIPGAIGLILNGFLIFLIFSSFLYVAQHARQQNNRTTFSSDEWIPDGAGWHVDRQHGFALRFPDEWEVRKDAFEGVAVIALSPQESANDTFRENVTVFVVRTPVHLDTAVFFEANIRNMRANTEGYEQELTGSLRVDGLDCSWVSYKQTAGGVATRARSYMLVDSGRGYCLTCSAAPEDMNRFQDQFEAIVKTLRIPHK